MHGTAFHSATGVYVLYQTRILCLLDFFPPKVNLSANLLFFCPLICDVGRERGGGGGGGEERQTDRQTDRRQTSDIATPSKPSNHHDFVVSASETKTPGATPTSCNTGASMNIENPLSTTASNRIHPQADSL